MAALSPSRYVPALDGLRALSVLLVIGYHADVPHLSGGFLGVEVFFVVSGYLITALLLGELERTGRIALLPFWGRRARRLLPALFTVLAAALLLARARAPELLVQTRSDALAALGYVSNWWQVVNRHSYFMDVDRPPLLLHLWSLAVEEQFYLVWPLLVALIGRWDLRWLRALALLVAGASACWMGHAFDAASDPTRVYVGTDTRLSGLLLGAALATVLPLAGNQRIMPRAVSEALGLAGLGGLAWATLRLTSHEPLLYRGGLVLVDLCSCALIAALLSSTWLARALGTRPAAWLGRRSYGLYLWHWPVFAVTRPELDLAWSEPRMLALRLALTSALSELCYRAVEAPLRRTTSWARVSATAVPVAAAALLALTRTPDAAARSEPMGNPAPRDEVRTELAAAPVAEPSARAVDGIALDPAWPKTLTLLTDSVGLALNRSLPAALPEWKVEILGRPALMVKQVVPEFLNARPVGSVVVVALAYNSLFERDRKNYERWNGIWDRGAERLLSDLKACGAKKIVWVTLREPSAALVDDTGRDQYQRYAWFFPYANERIRLLAERHPDLALADWQAVSNVPGLTRDLIHLNPAGVETMTGLITRSVLGPSPAERATH